MTNKAAPLERDDSVVEEDNDDSKKDDTKDEETSSSSSSTAKSGSRGGYSADCSASDDQQSSDDTGGGSAKPALALSSLNLESESASCESASSPGCSSADEEENGTKDGKPRAVAENGKPSPEIPKRKDHGKASSSKIEASIEMEGQRQKHQSIPSTFDAMADKAFNKEAAFRTDLMLNGKPLPQWNGVVIRDVMDPRIDLSTVGTTVADVPAALQPLVIGQAKAPPGTSQEQETRDPRDALELPSLESYMHLMEAVRPFFQAQGASLAQAHQQALRQADLEQQQEECTKNDSSALSSEGFTSFFTTTDSIATKDGASGSGGSPTTSDDMDKKLRATYSNSVAAKEGDHPKDDSSMAVLARAKRKYRQQFGESSSSSNTTSSSSLSSREKRVRIQEVQQPRRDHRVAAAEANERRVDNEAEANDHPRNNVAPVASLPIVTDVSSSARTSGSGSGGNTGSGSNQGTGSSGSGNDAKGSSEELTKEDISGDGANDGSDGSNDKKLGIGLGGGPAHRHPSATCQEPPHRHSSSASTGQEPPNPDSNAAREQKLLDKKRKRIEMRREYEAQQQFESSESSETKDDQYFRPARPVTLDQVLVFSKIPRIVVQGAPPFLVVHTNAAYCRLTGVDSHVVVGKPISALMSMQDVATTNEQEQIQESPEEFDPNVRPRTDLAAAEAFGRARADASVSHDRTEISLERLIATCGFGRLHVVHVNTKPHQMLGRNVTVMELSGHAVHGTVRRHEDSNGTSLTSSFKEEQQQFLSCRISIAPIVSSDSSVGFGAPLQTESEPHHIEKRVKHHHGSEHDRKYSPLHFVTHFVIQLQPQCEGLDKNGCMESLSSNSKSVEAQLLGLSKEGVQNQREVLAAPLADAAALDESVSERSDAKEAVAAIG